MKKFILLSLAIIGFTAGMFAQNPNVVHVNGYYRSNGTYVNSYYRTAPNNTINDNFSTYPNINPYTGQQGTIAPDYSTYGTYNNYYTQTHPTYNTYTPSTYTPSTYTPTYTITYTSSDPW
mgnify:CR=1 FL=1